MLSNEYVNYLNFQFFCWLLYMKITIKHVDYFVKHVKLDLRTEKFSKNDLKKGMIVELEHGTISSETNVTNNNIVKTGKIALAHLREFPDYYKRLRELEKTADKYWKNKSKKKSKKKSKNNSKKITGRIN